MIFISFSDSKNSIISWPEIIVAENQWIACRIIRHCHYAASNCCFDIFLIEILFHCFKRFQSWQYQFETDCTTVVETDYNRLSKSQNSKSGLSNHFRGMIENFYQMWYNHLLLGFHLQFDLQNLVSSQHHLVWHIEAPSRIF